ncbi:MAG: hypothetical protein Q8N03_07870 [Ignavibacteria bacterium]|nr:hypothetical protein [Ignavibacteria bacterium]
MFSKTNDLLLKVILIIIAIGIWGLFLQNAGVISTKQTVYVKGGYIDANVSGSVGVSGSVDVDNTVDVNLDKVLGYPVGCRASYTIDGRQFNSIDVSVR